MALIGDIRRNPWILIVFIALGLGGFIFMDSFGGDRSVMGSQGSNIGEINGTKIDQRQFNLFEQTVYGNSTTDVFTRRNIVWNYFVEDALLNDEAESLGGLGVSPEEMKELIFGQNVSPIVRSAFPGANGQVDYATINSLKPRLTDNDPNNEELKTYWSYLEKQVMKERKQSKLNALISKAMYAPTWQLNQIHQEQNQQVDFSYVRIPYGDIEDVELTDADYKTYIQKNKATLMKDEETRKVEYVAFDILPTVQDSVDIRNNLTETKDAWATTDNDTTFVSSRLGALDGSYFQKDQINTEVADALFGAPAGTTYGPYIEGNNYRIAKIIDEKVVADSVRSRHILLRATTQAEANAAAVRIDSMITELEAGTAVFDTLAARFGTDGTANSGGDLGYIGNGGMVKAFNDLIFFHADKGEYNTVITQYGIHLVEVTGTKFINRNRAARIGYISEQIIPSENTQNDAYQNALEFVSKNRDLDALRSASNAMGLSTEVAGPFGTNDYILGELGSGQTSREIIQFAFNPGTRINDVSPEIYTFQDPVTRVSNKLVLAALTHIAPEGLPTVDAIRDDIAIKVANMKKAEMMMGKISSSDLSGIAGEYDSQVDTVNNVSFSSGFAAGLGSEPQVIAAAFDLDQGQSSKAIEGANGVYVLNVIGKREATGEPNIASLRRTTASSTAIQTTTALMNSMKKDADIEDSRSTFF